MQTLRFVRRYGLWSLSTRAALLDLLAHDARADLGGVPAVVQKLRVGLIRAGAEELLFSDSGRGVRVSGR